MLKDIVEKEQNVENVSKIIEKHEANSIAVGGHFETFIKELKTLIESK